MELSKEAMQYLHGLGKTEIRFIASPLEPRTFYRISPDGSLEPVTVPLEPLPAKVFTVENLLEMLRRTAGEDGAGAVKTPCMVLVAEDKAVAIAEAPTYRTRFTLELPKHPVYKILQELKETKTFGQRDLIRLLAAKLGGYVDSDVVGQIRVIKIKAEANTTSTMKQGAGGFSQQAYQEAAAENGQKPPEEFFVSFPVFDTPDMRLLRCKVKVLVEMVVDEQGTRFELTTVHDDLARALDDSINELMIKIEDEAEGIPVYAASA
jgi:hypothetical protein